MNLPKEIDYTSVLPSLSADTASISTVIMPSNGSTFGPSSTVFLDLPSQHFIDPSTMYLRYKVNLTSAASAEVKGTPAYTFFNSVQTTLGSSIVENIQNYNQTMAMIVNLTHSSAHKQSMAVPYGYNDPAMITAVTTQCDNLNGRICALNETFSLSMPLKCVISESSKLVPMFVLNGCRITLNVDSIGGIFTSAVVPTNFSLSNIELCYDSINFGSSVESMVKSMGLIYIKSQSLSTSTSILPTATSGSIDLIYNLRLASIKSVFSIFSGTSANSINKNMDSYDVTSNNGDYQYLIGNKNYPSRPLSTLNAKSCFSIENKSAIGGFHDVTNSSAISPVEFSYVGNAATTLVRPAKFYVSQNVEKLKSNGVLLSGISSQSSPINLRINTNTATAQSHNVSLICLYDALIEIDTINNTANVKQ